MSAIGTAPLPTAPVPTGTRARRTLLSSCAVASALVAIGHPLPVAAADGYNATIDSNNTFGYFGATGANQAQIRLDNTTSVITWSPNNQANTTGSIQFQDAGGVTTFVGPRGGQDYTVLNRVIPTDQTRSITFGGTTNSYLGDGATRGGNIWFYSPGGIVVGAGARFDVGSLLLSTNSIGYVESGYGALNPGQIRFDYDSATAGGAANGTSSITINRTASLNALGAGANYIALVAPRIVQSGSVSATQTAYIAAEAGDMTIDAGSGLFSFAISTGSTVADALTHNGTTALTAGGSTAQRAFLVAVPKNEAITMLVGGTIQYAAAASVDNGVVVLSSGNVSDGINPQTVNGNFDAIVGGTTNIVIGGGGTFSSIRAAASGTVTTSGGFTATGDVRLFGSNGVSVAAAGAGAANAITINRLANGTGGNLTLQSWIDGEDGSRTGQSASLSATGGAVVTIGGGVTVDTSGVAREIFSPSFAPLLVGPAGPAGTGGTATLSVTDSQMTIAGAVSLNANGVGLDTFDNGGIGTGGTASITTTNGALAIGGGADGTGTGGLIVSANGIGGIGSQGGDGVGNIASITATGLLTGQTNAIRVAGTTTVTANGVGGAAYNFNDGETPGIGTGGTASITLNPLAPPAGPAGQATFSGGGSVTIGATGTGGSGLSSGYTVPGSAGTGGTALLAINGGTFGATALTVDASGTGGAGSNTSDNATPGAGGNGTGGGAGVTGNGGGLNVTTLTIGAGGFGGAGGSAFASGGSGYGAVDGSDGGSATGGRAVLIGSNGFAARPTGVLTVNASGTGGAGGTSSSRNAGNGGDGDAGSEATVTTGGLLPGPQGAYVTLQGGSSVSASQILVLADGGGGAGGVTSASGGILGDGGAGSGGSARVSNSAATGSITATSTTLASRISARGTGGGSGISSSTGTSGTGGAGLGGGHGTTLGGASLASAGSVAAFALAVDAGASGGAANLAGGSAIGGKAAASFTAGGSITRTTLFGVNASATGGTGNAGFLSRGGGNAVAGDGTGGLASFTVDGTAVTLDQAVTITADGTGGGADGSSPSVLGGDGTGGTAEVIVRNGGTANLGGDLTVAARGIGGDGRYAAGGAGAGGAADVRLAGGSLNAGSLTIAGSASGGRSDGDNESNSHDGGAATGGTAALTIAPSTVGPAGSVTVIGGTLVDASATGGLADDSNGSSDFAIIAAGGAGTGGSAFVDVQTGSASFDALDLVAGGSGGASIAGGAGGDGTGGTARLSVGTINAFGGGITATSISVGASAIGGGHTTGPVNEMSTGYGGKGGAGIGGRAILNLYGGTINVAESVNLGAGGGGGGGGEGASFFSDVAGAGGDGLGGTAAVTIVEGTLSAASLAANTDGSGGVGGISYFDTPGASGRGIAGGAVSGTGTPLTGGTGASVAVSGAAGSIQLTGNLQLSASGTGAAGVLDDFFEDTGSAGGAASGGLAELAVTAGAGLTASNIAVRADAAGGAGAASAVGGDAAAGRATIRVEDSSLTTTDTATDDDQRAVLLTARADGGSGGGSAIGGIAGLSVTGSGTYNDDMLIDVSATGTNGSDGTDTGQGFGSDGTAGGNASAGTVNLDVASGTIDGLSVLASASAGNGGNAVESGYGTGNSGAGGNATAGTVTIGIAAGSIQGLTVLASASAGAGGGVVETGYGSGTGGSGGAGGNAAGGPISITASGSAAISFAPVVEGASIDASRRAGSGGAGGRGANGPDGSRGANGVGTGANGQAGGAGGAGQAGSAGGVGGSATGSLVSLTAADGGTITLAAGEGSFQVDLAATAGTGGAGGSGGNGGAGGAGGSGGPAGTGPGGATIPAGQQGATGAEGTAGIGGAGGNGGTATGGSLAFSAAGGTISAGDLTISTRASGAYGGAAGTTGSGNAATFAATGLGGSGIAGNVTISSSDSDVEGVANLGRFSGGALNIDASGDPGYAGDFSSNGEGRSGRVALLGQGSYLSDEDVPTGSIALTSLDVSAFGQPPLGYGDIFDPTLASIDVLASNGRVSIANDANLSTSYQVSLRAENGGTIAIGGALNASADSALTTTQAGEGQNAITANTVNFRSYGDLISQAPIVATATADAPGTINMRGAYVIADNLTATDSISLAGAYYVSAGNLTTTAPVNPDATSLEEAGGGTIDIVAGGDLFPDLLPNTDLADANIEVTGALSASNRVSLTAGGDITLFGENGARIESGNLARIDAGDDVWIRNGATVRAGLTPLADPSDTGAQDLDTPAGLFITAGLQPVRDPVAGNPHVVVVDGTLSSGVLDGDTITGDPALRRGILLSGDAVQAEGGIAGRSLTVVVNNAPAPGTDRAENVDNLFNGCLVGDACLGNLDLTNLLTVGALTGAEGVPTTVRIAGGASTQRTSIRSQGDISLGSDGGSTTFDGRDLLRVESLLGAVNLPGDTVLSGGNVVQVLGATGIFGDRATIQSDNTVGLYTGSGGLRLGNLIAGNLRGITPNSDGDPTEQFGGLSINGPVTINNVLSVSNGDADITAAGALSVANVEVSDGYSIFLRSTGGDAIVGNAATGALGTAYDIDVSSDTGAAGLASGIALRDIRVTAATTASVGTVTAGDDIELNGATVDIGSATTTGSFAETGYGSSGDGSNISATATGAITVAGSADARGDLTLFSEGGTVTANVLSAGDDVTVSGTRLRITSATTRGLVPEAGYGATSDGSNILLTATGADIVAGPAIILDTASAAVDPLAAATGDLTLQATNAAGSIVAGTLAAGRNISISAGGSVQLTNAAANGPALLSGPTDPVPSSGFVSITAGADGDGGYGAADIAITGTVSARGHIKATGGGDIVIGSAAKLLSDNRITLSAGDDIRIEAGALVQAAGSPLPSTAVVDPQTGQLVPVSPAELILSAGALQLNYTPVADNVASLIVDGTIAAAARPITLSAGAIQADGSALTAGTLTVNVGNSPAAGAPQLDDGGQLRAGCLQGDVCLGGVTLTGFTAGPINVPGALRIGGAGTSVPTNVRIAGAVDVASMDIAAKNSVTLGNSDTTPIAQTAGGGITINAAGGPVNLLGNLTLTGGTLTQPVTITAAAGVNGPAASIISRGRLDVSAPNGSVTLASVSAPTILNVTAGSNVRIGTVTGGAITLTGNGPDVPPTTGLPEGLAAVDLGTVDATTSLDINVPQGGIRFAALGAPSIGLNAGTFIAGGDATARQGDFSATAPGSIGLGIVSATGGIDVSAGGSFTAASLLSGVGAPDTDFASILVTASDSIDVGTARADRGDLGLSSVGAVTLGSGSAEDSIALNSFGNSVTTGALVAGTFQAPGNDGFRGAIDVRSSGDATVGSATAAGDVFMESGYGALVTGDVAAGGRASLFAQSYVTAGTVKAGGDILIDAGGDINLNRGEAAKGIALTSGGAITADILRAGTDITLDAATSIRVATDIAAGGAITATGTDIALNALGNLNIDTVDATAGNLLLASSGGAVRVNRGTATGSVTLSSTGGTAGTSPAVRSVTAGTLRAGTGVTVAALGAVTVGTAQAGGAIALTAGGQIRSGITATALRAGSLITATADGDIAINNAQAVNAIDLRSTNGAINATNLLATNSITARALGNLFVRDAVATSLNGNVLLAGGFPAGTGTNQPYSLDGSTNVTGTVSAGRSVIVNGGGRVTIGAGGRIRANGTIAIASGDDIVADAGSVIGLGHVTVAAPTGQSGTVVGGPSDSVTLAAGSLRAGTANRAANGLSTIAMNGTVDGVQIGFASEAVDIGAGGSVGSAATTQATFTNTAGRTIVGGNGDASAYAVSNATLGRVRAQRIGIVAPADVTVQTLALNGSAATNGNLIGNAAEFRITGGSTVSVEGAVALNSAAQTDLFAITAPTRIAVVTPTGSIALTAAGGAPGGRLALAAPRIIVGTAAGASALAGLTTVDLRDERLGVNDGALSEAGFLQANSLEFNVAGGTGTTVASALYIQNSGAGLNSESRRGFTAGAGGISILTGTGTPAEIIINGRQVSGDGGFITGRDLIPVLKISGTAQATMASFDPRSTANGCLIVGVSCRFDINGSTPPIQDTINQIIRGQDSLTGAISSVVQQLNSPLIELIDFTPFRLAGIIDEPVTGAGNDDFYAAFGGEDAFPTGGTLDQQVTGSGNDDLLAKPLADGKCDPNQRATDPDCR